MKAIRLEKPGHYAKVQIDEPQKPAEDEALVRVLRVGICGTDVSGFLNKMPFYSYPHIPGHELGVEVLETGAGVTHVKPGQRCAVEPYLNCQTCRACKAGRGNCCETLKVLGVMTDGGLRPRFVLPARKLHPAGDLAPEDLPLVDGDAQRLQQVFVNLIANASKFAPESSVIRVGASAADKRVTAWVEDEGPGIPDGSDGSIFERFRRGADLEPEPGGLGLGLWISKSIVDRHGGEISAARTSEGRTRFSVTLPAEQAE